MKNHSSKHVLHKLHIDQTSHSLTSLKSAGNHLSRKTFLMVMLHSRPPLKNLIWTRQLQHSALTRLSNISNQQILKIQLSEDFEMRTRFSVTWNFCGHLSSSNKRAT
jgi:hypothetical protein